jgi:hypothetical protein
MDANAREISAVSVARDVIVQLAPEELFTFDMVAESFLTAQRRVSRRREEPLGFGIEAGLVLLTPIVLALAQSVLETLAGDAGRSLARTTAARVGKVFRRRRARPEDAVAVSAQVASLSTAQLTAVRQQAVEKARQLNVDDERAALLADAIVGALATRRGARP